MDSDEIGDYALAVIHQIEETMLSEWSAPLTPFERRIIAKTVEIVSRDLY